MIQLFMVKKIGISSKPGSKNHDASNELPGSSWLDLELKLRLKQGRGGVVLRRKAGSLPAG